MSKQGFDVLRHANCCKITFNGGWESRQTEVDEITQLYAKELFNKKVVAKKSSEKLAGLQLQNDELQKRVDAAFRVLSQLNTLDDEAHKRWKREACMFSQGESNAYEHSVRLLEQALKGGAE